MVPPFLWDGHDRDSAESTENAMIRFFELVIWPMSVGGMTG